MTEAFTYRNRTITESDVTFIRQMIADHPQDGRSALSRRLCKEWGWLQPNGYPKAIVCRLFLLVLEGKGLIKLPPPKRLAPNLHLAHNHGPRPVAVSREPVCATIRELPVIELRQVRRTPEEKFFISLIEEHHYLGYTRPVGENLKYVAFAGKRPIACLAFSSAPYQIGCRDTFIGWSAEARARNRHLLAYNSRYLVFPWVYVPHLASHLLALCAKKLSADWERIYCHPIY